MWYAYAWWREEMSLSPGARLNAPEAWVGPYVQGRLRAYDAHRGSGRGAR